ncbi:glycosyltransferase family 2 protein, partial [Candidatus Bathyarchaeota archaeon]|nr:glycosyltransferase family 2 protein [Candidatus Bathyarchaeota archaeon]
RQISNGKPAALNYGVEHSRGEIIGVFDADSVLAPDALGQVCKYFEDPQVAAVQGRTLAINSNENMLTRFVAYEEAFWFEAYLRGKDALNLFVHLKGSCQFIRRASLEELNGFNQNSLSEDMELSARLTEKDLKIKYAPDVQAWQETPASLTHLIKQRTRWFRGTMEVAFKYGKLLAKKNVRSLDAEATLMGPFVLIASLAIYLVSLSSVFLPLYGNPAWFMLSLLTLAATTLTLVVAAATLIFASKRKPLSGLFWLPFLYFYWSLQTIIALYAMLTSLLNTPRKWTRTQKSGVIDNKDFSDKKTLTSKRPAP